jgi:hypothetical protein
MLCVYARSRSRLPLVMLLLLLSARRGLRLSNASTYQSVQISEVGFKVPSLDSDGIAVATEPKPDGAHVMSYFFVCGCWSNSLAG